MGQVGLRGEAAQRIVSAAIHRDTGFHRSGTLAAAMPLVSWVWKCSGRPTSSRSALTSMRTARGWQMPAMS